MSPNRRHTAVIITIGPSKPSEFMARLALSVNLTAAEYRRAQPRNLPSVPEAFRVLVGVDALRNSISIERLQGPIIMITAVIPCLHTSIMATDLSTGKELPLDGFSPGMIIALKSAKLDLTVPSDNDQVSVSPRMDLDLRNIDNDIILRITILRGINKVFFNDHANKSLLDGWGQEQSVELSQVDVDRWRRSGVTISVHDCSTHSKEQYQILFDLTTMCFFDKRFPGSPITIKYSVQRSPDGTSDSGIPAHGVLSDPLKVFTYNVDDLPLVEKQAVKSGR